MLFPTPPELLCDAQGRPYFLWDADRTLAQLESKLQADDQDERLVWVGAVLRQAKPDDAIVLLGKFAIQWAVPRLLGKLGRHEPMWRWLVERWGHGA